MDKKVEVRHKKNKKGSKAQKSKKIVLKAGSKDILCGLWFCGRRDAYSSGD